MRGDQFRIVVKYTENNELKIVEQSNDKKSKSLLKNSDVKDFFSYMLQCTESFITASLNDAEINGIGRSLIRSPLLWISVQYTYLNYLQEEKAKNPGFDTRSHAVAIVQTAFAAGIEVGGGFIGGAAVSARTMNPYAIAAGSFAGGVASIYAIDKVKVLGNGASIIDDIGDITRQIYPPKEMFSAEIYQSSNKHVTANMEYEFNGKKVLFADTKEEVAAKLDIPIERIYEDTDADDQPSLFLRVKQFIILPESSDSEGSLSADISANSEVKTTTQFNHNYIEQKEEGIKEHKVATGDTLWGIASSNGVTVDELLQHNPSLKDDPSRIYPDQVINIPQSNVDAMGLRVDEVLVQSFSGLSDKRDITRNVEFDAFIKGNLGSFTGFQDKILSPFWLHSNKAYSQEQQFRMGLLEATGFLQSHMQMFKYTGFDFAVYKLYTIRSLSSHDNNLASGVQYTVPKMHNDFMRQFNPQGIASFQNSIHKQTTNFNHGNLGNIHNSATYKIKYGDTLSKIARSHGVKLEDMLKANAYISNPNKVFAGHRINIPNKHPIVIDLGNNKVDLIPYTESHVFYDMDSNDYKENTAWVSREDALLVYDYDQNNVIRHTQEIVLTQWSEDAKSDLDALIKYFDDNKDGVFDSKDREFSKFLLWQDRNLDGESQPYELKSLHEAGIVALELTVKGSESISGFGEVDYFTALWNNGKNGKAYDVIFKHSHAGIKREGSSISVKFREQDSKVITLSPSNEQDFYDFIETASIVLGTNKNNNIYIDGFSSVMVKSGDGKDQIVTGFGNDWVHCVGKCEVRTRAGHDVIIGDVLYINGGSGYDVFLSTAINGTKIDMGASSIEAFYGTNNHDIVNATSSYSGVYIKSGAGKDDITGSEHDDIILVEEDIGFVNAGKGNDIISLALTSDFSKIKAGPGNDTILIEASNPVEIDLGELEAEIIVANNQNNIIRFGNNRAFVGYGNSRSNQTFYGGSGTNIYVNKGGHDVIFGGEGDNIYYTPICNGSMTIHAGKINREMGKDVVVFPSIPSELISFHRLMTSPEDLTIYSFYEYNENTCEAEIIFKAALNIDMSNMPSGFIIPFQKLNDNSPGDVTMVAKYMDNLRRELIGKFASEDFYEMEETNSELEQLFNNNATEALTNASFNKMLKKFTDALASRISNNFVWMGECYDSVDRESGELTQKTFEEVLNQVSCSKESDELFISFTHAKHEVDNFLDGSSPGGKHLLKESLLEIQRFQYITDNIISTLVESRTLANKGDGYKQINIYNADIVLAKLLEVEFCDLHCSNMETNKRDKLGLPEKAVRACTEERLLNLFKFYKEVECTYNEGECNNISSFDLLESNIEKAELLDQEMKCIDMWGSSLEFSGCLF